MSIDIFGKNITLDNPLRIFIEEKIGGLARYFKHPNVRARVEIGKPSRHHRKGPVFYAEASVTFDAKVLRAEAQHNDLRTAIIEVRDGLRIQIAKQKKRTSVARARVRAVK